MATPGVTWTWRPAAGTDVTAIMDLTRDHFKSEATAVWRIDEQWFARSLTVDIVNQFFNPASAMIAVAVSPTNQLLAYVWVERGVKTVWSSEEMIAVKIVHVDLDLAPRDRVRLVQDMMQLWETWARSIGVDIVCSSTMRAEQTGFLRLHQRRGYDCRGSICYLRLEPRGAVSPDPDPRASE